MTTFETLSACILVVTVVAIIAGPIAAVWVTRRGDLHREERTRKAYILSTLMRTRQARLSPDHVGALNLIQLEFHGDASIQTAYSNYIANLYQPVENAAQIEERNDRFIDLLHQIGNKLGYKFDKRDLHKLAYGPTGWYDDENAVKMMRSMAMDLMTGKSNLSVVMRQAPLLGDKFPPPPQIENSEAEVK